MKFQFKVNMTDEDYFLFNKFQAIDSPFGKKQIQKIRLVIAATSAVLTLVSLWLNGFTADSFIGLIPFLLIMIILVVTVPKTFAGSIKRQLKLMKKHGKQGYSPESVVEFYDDYFSETTPDNKTEHKYSAVENIFAVEGKYVYIFVNNVMAYIIPRSSFESVGQYNDFLTFMESKCSPVKYC